MPAGRVSHQQLRNQHTMESIQQMKDRIDRYRSGGSYLDSTAPWYQACDEFAQSYLPTDYLLSVGAGGDAEIQAALV